MRQLIGLSIFLLPFVSIPVFGEDGLSWGIGLDTLTGTAREHGIAVDRATDIGLRAFRDTLPWTLCEIEPGVVDIPQTVIDKIDFAVERGLDPVLVLDCGHPAYDNGRTPRSREAIEAYIRYVRTVVQQLRGRVRYFEIPVEPIPVDFRPLQGNPEIYASLLKAVAPAIREENPDAFILGGAVSGIDPAFLREVFEEGAFEMLDLLSVHLRVSPGDPVKASFPDRLDRLEQLCQDYGHSKPIWITQLEVFTPQYGDISPQCRADLLAKSILLSRASPLVHSIFWRPTGPGEPITETPKVHFSLLDEKGRANPVSHALKTLIAKFTHAIPEDASMDEDDGVFSVQFRKPDESRITAFWRGEGTGDGFSFHDSLLLSTVTGHSTLLSGNLPVQWTLSPSPVYVESGQQPLRMDWPEEEKRIFRIDGSRRVALGAASILSVSPAGAKRIDSWKIEAPDWIAVESFPLPERDSTTGTLGLGRLQIDPEAPTGQTEAAVLLYDEKSDLPFARLVYELMIVTPVHVRISPLPPVENRRRVVLIDAYNQSTLPLSGKVEVQFPHLPDQLLLSATQEVFTDLLPGGSVSFPVTLRGTFSPDMVLETNAIVTTSEGLVVRQEKPITFYPSLRKAGPIVIDGDLTDWSRAESIRIEREEQIVFQQQQWAGVSDFSATVRTCWDEEYFYFAAEVADDFLAAPFSGQLLDRNDGLELFFHSDPFKGSNRAGFDPSTSRFGLFHSPQGPQVYRWQPEKGPVPGSKIVLIKSDRIGPGKNLQGYVIEAAIPFSELGFAPDNGRHVGFAVQLTDHDAPDAPASAPRQRLMSWTGQLHTEHNPEAFTDLFFVDPQLQGRVILDGARTLVDGQDFFPFGFWTFGQSEHGFHRLRQMGVNTVGVAWPWAELEPKEGQFDNQQMDRHLAFLDLAHKYGQHVVIQWDVHVEPEWLIEKYPDLRPLDPQGHPVTSDFMQLSLTHPMVRNRIHQLMAYVVRAVRNHPAVLAYSPWNEPAFSGDMDYSPTAVEAFQQWSKEHAGLNTVRNFDLLKDVEDLKRLQKALVESMGQVESIEPVARDHLETNREDWLLWMKFRQNSFTRFFQWWRTTLQRYDNRHPVTLKLIWKPLDSRYAWESGANYELLTRSLDILGSDPYPHPGEFFVNRWISDWNRSVAPGRPRWFLEYNRAFAQEYGLPRKEELQSNFWQSVLHGMNGCLFFFWPMQPFDPEWGDNAYGLLEAKTLASTGASRAIEQTAHLLSQVRDSLVEAVPTPARVAILHDWNTLFQMPGDPFPTAGATTLAQMLYRSQIPVDYLSSHQVKTGALRNYKVLVVAGAVAPDDNTLERIHQFHQAGGAVIATARFAERNEHFDKRQSSPPDWFGCRVIDRKILPRQQIGQQTVDMPRFRNNGVSDRITMQRPLYSAVPVTLQPDGVTLEAGPWFGFEDMQMTEQTVEQLELTGDGRTIGVFPDGSPAVVETDRTLYLGRDPSYSDEGWRRLIRDFVLSHGVDRAVWVTDTQGQDLGHVDAGLLWRPDGSALLGLVNAARIFGYDGSPVDVIVHLGRVTGKRQLIAVESGRQVSLEDASDGSRIFRTHLTEGQVRLYRLPSDR